MKNSSARQFGESARYGIFHSRSRKMRINSAATANSSSQRPRLKEKPVRSAFTVTPETVSPRQLSSNVRRTLRTSVPSSGTVTVPSCEKNS